MKDNHRQARKHKYARLHRLATADGPDAFPEENEAIEGALTVNDDDSLPISDTSSDDLTADTLIGDPREERPPPDEADEALRVPRHHWIHRRPRGPGLRARQSRN
jgi:hypothetical protein